MRNGSQSPSLQCVIIKPIDSFTALSTKPSLRPFLLCESMWRCIIGYWLPPFVVNPLTQSVNWLYDLDGADKSHFQVISHTFLPSISIILKRLRRETSSIAIMCVFFFLTSSFPKSCWFYHKSNFSNFNQVYKNKLISTISNQFYRIHYENMYLVCLFIWYIGVNMFSINLVTIREILIWNKTKTT